MNPVTPQDVIALAEEFAQVPAPRVQIYLDIAATMINPAPWGAAYPMAHKLLAAHLLTGGLLQGAPAPVKSITVGGVSTSYGTTASERDGLAASEYGSAYMHLMQANIIAPLVL